MLIPHKERLIDGQEVKEKPQVLEPPYVEFSPSECKGCQLCADACPRKCIVMSQSLNEHSYIRPRTRARIAPDAAFVFYACPEPGAIKVYKKKSEKAEE